MGNMDEIELYLRDALADEDSAADQFCVGCSASGGTQHPHEDRPIRFQRSDKCEICHIVHVLWKGEISWRDSLTAWFARNFP